MTDPTGMYSRERILQSLRFGFTDYVPMPMVEQSLTVESLVDRMTDRLVIRLRAEVLAERAPTQPVRGIVTVPRWATWRDQFKDAHRSRWWMAWWIRRHPVRYIDEPHHVTVPIHQWWTYPHIPHVIPGGGYSVLKTLATDAQFGLHGWR